MTAHALYTQSLSEYKSRPSSSSDMLYGINITFPDGVIISIKQGSSFGIHRFIDLYNRKIQEEQSCLL